VSTVGISTENYIVDVSEPLTDSTTKEIRDVVNDRQWHAVLCTIGVNRPAVLGEDTDPVYTMERDYAVNVLAPMMWLDSWLRYWIRHEDDEQHCNLHFAVVSSNSAHVSRSTGTSYCSSKAALSQAVRCVARDYGSRDHRISVYGYELGVVADTMMTKAVARRLPPDTPLSRAPGGRALTRHDVAKIIVNNFDIGHAINGSLIRIDGGEV